VKEVSSVEKFLRINGQDGIENHYQKPERRCCFDQRKKHLRSSKPNRETQEQKQRQVAQQQFAEARTEISVSHEQVAIK
jgi:hypothetical protein